jgi:predicted hotdog family 3-hydroxylacyl-ACP dehydratase
MTQNVFEAATLIPQSGRMKLLDRVIKPSQKELQAETAVTETWPLAQNGAVSALLCIELVAQAISALSTWRKGEGAVPRPGLLVGIKESQLFCSTLPIGTQITVGVQEVYHLGNYAVFAGRVTSGSSLLCTATLQVMEPEEEGYLYLLKERGSRPGGKE